MRLHSQVGVPLVASDCEGKAHDIHGIGWKRKDGTYMKAPVSFLEMFFLTIFGAQNRHVSKVRRLSTNLIFRHPTVV